MSNDQGFKLPWVKQGDLDATIGVFFDGFTKILVGVSVITGVMKMPSDIVFGKIVSAIGISAFLMLAFSTLYARYVGKKTNNKDITALPGGISGGTFFVWLNAIMIPTFFATKDPMKAWSVAVCASIIYSLFMLVCSFIINIILKYIPSEAMLGSLVGGSMAWLLMASLGEGYATPLVVVPTLFILLTFYFAKINLKKLSPAFIAIGAGTVIAWVTGVMNPGEFMSSFQTVGLYIPIPQIGLISGESFSMALKFLPIIVAFAFADITAIIQAVEQAKVSNEIYDRKVCMMGLSCINIVGALFGNPFPMNFYWGHPAWKQAKAGTSYPLFTGIIYLVLCTSGLVAIATSAIPVGATMVLLVYAAICTGSQAFEATSKKYYPAMIMGVAIPIFEIIYNKVNGAIGAAQNAVADGLSAAGIDFAANEIAVTGDYLAASGIPKGFEVLSQGSMCIAIIFVAVLVFVIDRKWLNAAVTFLVASGCAFIGLIHSSSIKLYAAPEFVWVYLVMAAAFFIIHITRKGKEIPQEVSQ